MSSKKIVNGKGNETHVARCLSSKLNVPVEYPNFYLDYEKEFLVSVANTNYEECVNDLTTALVNKLDFRPTRLYFNHDAAGCHGDRADIVVTDEITRQGYSLKWNSTELSSKRFGPQSTTSFLTGNEIDIRGVFDNYPETRVRFREARSRVTEVLDRYCDVVVDDLKQQYALDKQPCLDRVAQMINGCDEDMLLVKIQKRRRNQCFYSISENPPIITDIDLASIGKQRRRNALSTSLSFNVRTIDGQEFTANIRIKNGNEHTHTERGNPNGFKTSVTRREIA